MKRELDLSPVPSSDYWKFTDLRIDCIDLFAEMDMSFFPFC